MAHGRLLITAETPVPEVIEINRDRWNATPTDELVEGVIVHKDYDTGTRLMIANPYGYSNVFETNEEGKSLIIQDLPFANGAWPWHVLGTQWLADITGHSVVSFAANGTDGSKYKFDRSEKKELSEGNFDPYVIRGMRALSNIVDVGKIATVGISQGGTTSIARARFARNDYDVTSVAAFDPPTVSERSRLALLSDFGKAGYDKLEDELRQADIKALLEVFGYEGPDKTNNLKRTLSFLMTIINQLPNQWHITEGLGQDNLAQSVVDLLKGGVNVTLGNGQSSAIMTPNLADKAWQDIRSGLAHSEVQTGELTMIEFEATTHAGVDNKVKLGTLVLASLGKLA